MEEWVESVFQGKSVEDMIPVNVPPEVEYAEMLKSRLEFIRNYLSDFKDENT
jgi:Ni,Fe-hydrogenase III large subunit